LKGGHGFPIVDVEGYVGVTRSDNIKVKNLSPNTVMTFILLAPQSQIRNTAKEIFIKA